MNAGHDAASAAADDLSSISVVIHYVIKLAYCTQVECAFSVCSLFDPGIFDYAALAAVHAIHSFIHSYSFIKVGLTHCDNLKYIAKVENSVNTSL